MCCIILPKAVKMNPPIFAFDSAPKLSRSDAAPRLSDDRLAGIQSQTHLTHRLHGFIQNLCHFRARFFFPSCLFAAIGLLFNRVSGTLLYWSASKHWDCLYWPVSKSGKSKGKIPRQSPLTNQRGCGGRRLGSAGAVRGGH